MQDNNLSDKTEPTQLAPSPEQHKKHVTVAWSIILIALLLTSSYILFTLDKSQISSTDAMNYSAYINKR